MEGCRDQAGSDMVQEGLAGSGGLTGSTGSLGLKIVHFQVKKCENHSPWAGTSSCIFPALGKCTEVPHPGLTWIE